MTKVDREKIEKALDGLYGRVVLNIDGFKITLVRGRISKNQLGVVIYVNDEVKGEWLGSERDNPVQKFMRRSERFLLPAKERASQKKFEKKYGKRRCRELGYRDPDAKYVCYLPYWSTGKAALRHLIKVGETVEIVEVIG
ncbi:MAG: hypothetical protein C0621_00105 [Desulfuromonas sp.]|nr:MAG: hypothetical protein C0621_00105 [Desulfuromonas sp.]